MIKREKASKRKVRNREVKQALVGGEEIQSTRLSTVIVCQAQSTTHTSIP